MKNTIYILGYFATIILLNDACDFQSEQVIPSEKSPSKIVVLADLPIGVQATSFMYITRTRSVGDNIVWDFNNGDKVRLPDSSFFVNKGNFFFDTVKQCKIEIFENNKQFDTYYTLNKFGEGDLVYERTNYSLPYKKNTEYKLMVTAPGFDTVSSTQTVPTVANIISVKFKRNSYQSAKDGILSELLIEFDDEPNEKNVYTIDITKLVKTKDQIIKFKEIKRLKTFKIDSKALNEKLINDKFFDGKRYTWRVGVDIDFPMDKPTPKDSIAIGVYLNTVSPNYEKYIVNKEAKEASLNNPFAEPISPYSNLKGGLGYFIFSARSIGSIIIE